MHQMHMLYGTDDTPGNDEIFFRASQGLGTINISNNTGFLNPQIATSGNNVYVTWKDDTLWQH